MKVRATRDNDVSREYGIMKGETYEVATTEAGNPAFVGSGVLVRVPGTDRTYLLAAGGWQAVEIDGAELRFVTEESRAKARGDR